MRRLPFLVLLLTLVSSVGSAADLSSRASWQAFRSTYPYHIQTLAISEPDSRGERVFIISEPPPDTRLERLKTRWPQAMRRATIQKQAIGVNGWAADIVTVLPAMSEDAVSDFIAGISGDLFGTSYKSYAQPLGAAAAAPVRTGEVDLTVDIGQVVDWFGLAPAVMPGWAVAARAACLIVALVGIIGAVRTRRWKNLKTAAVPSVAYWAVGTLVAPGPPQAMVMARHQTNPTPIRLEAALGGAGGVYDSRSRGLVVLVVPARTPLDHYTVSLREFVLDSDLILGAVGTPAGTAIIARERVQPLSVLPPLRVETLLQLASVETDELAQSYERNHVFAGRFDRQQHRDWAPIYLSDELKDTEYGSLLNITDQLLKSWSQHGEVHYANFKYPEPDAYPFPVGLMQHAKVRHVTFNWNTKGVGYSDRVGDYDVLAFNRTGALPVDYLGDRDARLREAEDQAYDYFARRHDPNLARVVQYAGLYQIFRHYGVTAARRAFHSSDAVPERELLEPTERLIAAIRQRPVDDFIAPDMRRDPELQPIIADFEAMKQALDDFSREYGAPGEKELAAAVLEPRVFQKSISGEPTGRQKDLLTLSYALSRSEIVKDWISDGRGAVMRMYAALSGGHEQTWIHTPSLVISWPVGARAENLQGGHNLSSKITRFARSADLAPGQVRIVDSAGERTILHAAGDESRIHAAVRRAGRAGEEDAAAVERIVVSDISHAAVDRPPLPVALKLGEFTSNEQRGLLPAHVGVPLRARATWAYGPKSAAHFDRLATVHRLEVLPMVVERDAQGVSISIRGREGTIRAPDTASAIDAVVTHMAERQPAQTTVDLRFVNFEPQQAQGFIQSAEMRVPERLRLPMSGVVEPRGVRAAAVSERLAKGGWDPARATTEMEQLATGAVRHSVEIPAKELAHSPIRIIIEGTSEAVVRVSAAIRTFLANISTITDPNLLLAAIHDFLDSLRSVPGIRRIDPVIKHEAGDIIIVEMRRPGADDAAG